MAELVSLDDFLKGSEESVVRKLSLCNPDRIVRVEWRCVRRPEIGWLTCHSLIEGHLTDGRRMRLQKFNNRGFVALVLEPTEMSCEGAVYRGRAVGSQDLASQVLLAQDMHRLAAQIGSEPYCVSTSNCHHFARDLWNGLVVEQCRRSTYPDFVKTAVLRGAKRLTIDQIGTVLIGNDLICADMPSDDEADLEAGLGSGVHMTMREEEAGRLCGRFSAPRSCRPCYNRMGRLEDFARLLEVGAVYFMETAIDSGLVLLQSPSADLSMRGDRGEIWANKWLQDAGEAGSRLAERVTGTDIVSLMSGMPAEGLSQEALGNCRGIDNQRGVSFKSILGSFDSSKPEEDLVQDLCFVVLRSAGDLRLVAYAILRPAPVGGGADRPVRRLRLLGGSALAGEEGYFTYAMCELPNIGDGPSDAIVTAPRRPAATDLAREEETALRTALSTGDWGFVTLL